jgi:2-oxoglutarate dehydrogenase E2 component (dihydrolipoamide succinyltransferase)
MRRRIAAHMVESLLRTAPHVTNVFEADLTAVLADRARRKAAFERKGIALTLTAYFVAASVEALRAVPQANGRWTEDAILVPERIDIGVATALGDRGLVVPVIRDAGSLDLEGIAAALGELVARARDDRLTQADLRGGTFTISNHGVSGSLLAAPIVINQPQSAILGVGKLEKRAVVASEGGADRVVIRPRCYVTLTIDHRVLDGYEANRFMETFVRRLETWA